MPKLLSITKYAAHRGVSKAAVLKAIGTRRIQTVLDENENIKIDVETADKSWDENTNHSHNPKTLHCEKSESQTPQPEQLQLFPQQNIELELEVPSITYTEARTLRELYAAKLAKLEYEEKIGKLIDAAEMKKQVFEAAKLTKEAILNIPNRVSTQLSVEVDAAKIHLILTQELHAALGELANAHC